MSTPRRPRPGALDALTAILVGLAIALAVMAPSGGSAVAPPTSGAQPLVWPSLDDGDPPTSAGASGPATTSATTEAPPPPTQPSNPEPASIELVGDSLALSARTHLRRAFGDGPPTLRISAEEGRTIGAGLSQIRSAVAAEPDVLIVSLGTNDVRTNIDAVGTAVDIALADASSVPCVIWVDVQPFEAELEQVNESLSTAMDDYVGELGERRGGLARWSEIAGPAELHLADGYHLSDLGREAYADLVVASVADYC